MKNDDEQRLQEVLDNIIESGLLSEEQYDLLAAAIGGRRENIRQAVADYMRSEGCSCCQDGEAHEKHTAKLAQLLDVPRYDDGSGYNFARFRSDSSEDSGRG